MSSLSLLMPVFNERATAERAIAAALEVEYPVDSMELVIVDDGSTDGTAELLAEYASHPSIQVITHPANRGKGAALRTGGAHAKGEYVAIMDADLEYDPADVATLLGPLLSGQADAVFGKRAFDSSSAYSFWYVIGNKGVTLVADVLFDCWLADIMTCHKVMRTSTFQALGLTANGFDIEPEIAGYLLAQGERIIELPISYKARSREEGKKLTAVDGLRVVRTLLRIRFRERAGRRAGSSDVWSRASA